MPRLLQQPTTLAKLFITMQYQESLGKKHPILQNMKPEQKAKYQKILNSMRKEK